MTDQTIPLADVETRAGIVERWLKAALFNDAHVFTPPVYPHQQTRTITIKGFGGAQAEALRLNLYPHMSEVTVDVVGTWETTDPMDALSAMVYVAERIRK